jgi:hypothetical protein
MTGLEPALSPGLDSNQQFPGPRPGTLSIRSQGDALPLSYMAVRLSAPTQSHVYHGLQAGLHLRQQRINTLTHGEYQTLRIPVVLLRPSCSVRPPKSSVKTTFATEALGAALPRGRPSLGGGPPSALDPRASGLPSIPLRLSIKIKVGP